MSGKGPPDGRLLDASLEKPYGSRWALEKEPAHHFFGAVFVKGGKRFDIVVLSRFWE